MFINSVPYATKSQCVSDGDAPRLGGHRVTPRSTPAMSPCTSKGTVWIHKSYLFDGFQAREVLVSGNPKEIRRLLKLTTSTECDTIKCEDQLREIKRWPLAYLCLSCTGVTAAIYAICYPTCMKTYGLVTPAHPIRSKVFPPKHGRASPTKPQPGQFRFYQEQIPLAAPVSPSLKPPLTLCNQLPQNLSWFRTWSCTKRASILYIYRYRYGFIYYYYYFNFTALAMPT